MLCAFRGGDANMRSAWVCTRNDVLGNLAVLLAAWGVFGTGTGGPDRDRGRHHGYTCVSGGVGGLRQATNELRSSLALAPAERGQALGRGSFEAEISRCGDCLVVRTPRESDLGHFLLYSCRILFAARDYADDGGRHLVAKPLALGFR